MRAFDILRLNLLCTRVHIFIEYFYFTVNNREENITLTKKVYLIRTLGNIYSNIIQAR